MVVDTKAKDPDALVVRLVLQGWSRLVESSERSQEAAAQGSTSPNESKGGGQECSRPWCRHPAARRFEGYCSKRCRDRVTDAPTCPRKGCSRRVRVDDETGDYHGYCGVRCAKKE